MRAATTRSFILILGLLLLVGGLPGLARAQEATPNGQSGTLCDNPTPDKANLSDVPAEGVFVSPLSRPGENMAPQSVQVFQVLFARAFAAIPKCENPQITIAFVESGEFALDVGDVGTVSIDPPAGTPVRLMDSLGNLEPYYVDKTTDPMYLQNPDGTNCTDQCAVPNNDIVRVMPGSTVYAPQNARCLWCLMTALQGNLLVTAIKSNEPSASMAPFAWTQFDFSGNTEVIGALYGTPTPGTPAAEQWWFNPPTNCGRGG